MKSWLKIVLGVVVALVLVAIAAFLYADSIAKRAVERSTAQTLGVETELDGISLAILGGEAELKGFEAENPSGGGFKADHFLTIKEGDVVVTLGSLLGEKVIVPKVELKGLDVILEKSGGQNNYDVILANMKKQDQQDPNAQAGKKYVINELVISDIKVHADMLPIGGELTRVNLDIPEIRLKDVGSDSDNGVVMQEVTNVVLKAIFAAIVQKGGGVVPPDITLAIGKNLQGMESLSKFGIGGVGELGERLDETAKQVGKIGETLKGVIPRKKDE
jgi:uncharacterized protein involved in outer membrane biogenesis